MDEVHNLACEHVQLPLDGVTILLLYDKLLIHVCENDCLKVPGNLNSQLFRRLNHEIEKQFDCIITLFCKEVKYRNLVNYVSFNGQYALILGIRC